jgi:hypothetical protein
MLLSRWFRRQRCAGRYQTLSVLLICSRPVRHWGYCQTATGFRFKRRNYV